MFKLASMPLKEKEAKTLKLKDDNPGTEPQRSPLLRSLAFPHKNLAADSLDNFFDRG
jgi:hypothetical protein